MKARSSRPAWAAALGAFVAASAALCMLDAPDARAQVRGDATLGVGGVKRFASSAPEGAPALGVGPLVSLTGHVALFPLVRVGAYASAELGPDGEAYARRIYAGGLRVKLMPPWPRDEARTWVFLGLGVAGVYAPAFTIATAGPDGRGTTDAPGASGRYFEIPIGVGAEWRFRKPWALSLELSGRIGFGFSGALYDAAGRPGVERSSGAAVQLSNAGNDAFALGLTLGIGFDR